MKVLRLTLLVLCVAVSLRQANAHVPHDIIYSLGVSPDYAADRNPFTPIPP